MKVLRVPWKHILFSNLFYCYGIIARNCVLPFWYTFLDVFIEKQGKIFLLLLQIEEEQLYPLSFANVGKGFGEIYAKESTTIQIINLYLGAR